jgi:hypothetical protein
LTATKAFTVVGSKGRVCKRLLRREHKLELVGGLLPAVVVLLEPKPQFTVSLKVDERGFAGNGMVGILEDVRTNVPVPFFAIAVG